MNKPLNNESHDNSESIRSVDDCIKLAIENRENNVPLALKYAKEAVRISLNSTPEKDVFAVLSENSILPVSTKKEFAASLHILAECEYESSNFEKTIFYLNKAKEQYDEIKDKPGLCDVYVTFGKVFMNKGDFQDALTYNLNALKLSEEVKDTKRLMGIMNNVGFNYSNLGDNKKALIYLSKSLEYKRRHGDDSDISKTLNNLGIVYNAMGDYVSSLQFYKEAVTIVEALNQRKGVAILYMNIGLLYVKLSDTQKALKYLNRSLQTNIEIDYKKGQGECYVNIALAYRVMKNYDESLKNAYKSFQVAKEIGDKKVIAYSYQEIFKTLEDKKEYAKALEFGWKCYGLRKEIDHKQGLVEISHHLCNFFIETGELDKVLLLLEEAFKTCTQSNLEDYKIANYEIIARYYEQTGDFQKAAENYRLHIQLRSDMYNEEAKIKVGNLQAIFEIEQARRESEIYKLKNIDLADANKKLEVMNQEKNEFLNLVSHDLKNPLNSIYGFSNLLVEDINTLSMEEISDFASNINISSMAMLDLVNEILNSELMDSGRYELYNELIDLSILVKSLISMNKFQLRQKDIKIIFDEKIVAHVFSDANIVKQIISNLLSNAIKFSPEGKNIFITISHNKVDSSTSVSIKDEGPGISEEDKEKLFVKFAKLSAKPTAGESSTGLGLSIVKKLTDIISGDVTCESEQGKGANFILKIPTTPLTKKNN